MVQVTRIIALNNVQVQVQKSDS